MDQVRCFIAKDFLASPAPYLFMIDSDMVWTPDDFLRILAHASVMGCVAAAYRMKTDEEQFAANIPPEAKVNEYGCIPATGLGLGFCCVNRQIVAELARQAPLLRMGQEGAVPRVFRCDECDGHYRGEDVAFFADVAALGQTPWLDLQVELGHLGRKEYRGSFLNMLERWSKQSKAG